MEKNIQELKILKFKELKTGTIHKATLNVFLKSRFKAV